MYVEDFLNNIHANIDHSNDVDNDVNRVILNPVHCCPISLPVSHMGHPVSIPISQHQISPHLYNSDTKPNKYFVFIPRKLQTQIEHNISLKNFNTARIAITNYYCKLVGEHRHPVCRYWNVLPPFF